MSTQGARKYLYCILRAARASSPVKVLGVGNPQAEVSLISEGDIAAVVSSHETADQFDLLRDTRIQQRVLEYFLQDGPLVPASFGTVADGEEPLRTLLRQRRKELLGLLESLEGKIEAGVKVFWEKPAVIAEIEARWGKLEELKKRAIEQKDQVLSLRIGRAVAELIEAWKATHVEAIKETLAQCVLDARYSEPIGIRMLLNAAYLIPRDGLGAFETVVHELDRRYDGKMRFHLVVPLPPYNFAHLRITPEEMKPDGR
ncbi:MAG: GvpL/GvpF family gas vesicle protein [Bacillota bacterium]|nr:GvpL/GvpF family gas vesicle protein [Bacillota bacterium]